MEDKKMNFFIWMGLVMLCISGLYLIIGFIGCGIDGYVDGKLYQVNQRAQIKVEKPGFPAFYVDSFNDANNLSLALDKSPNGDWTINSGVNYKKTGKK